MKEEKEESKKSYEKEWEEKFEKKFENWGKCDHKWHHKHSHGFMGGGFYCLTFIGAAVYYLQNSSGFWMGVLAVLKALVWPAMLIYEVFTRLQMK